MDNFTAKALKEIADTLDMLNKSNKLLIETMGMNHERIARLEKMVLRDAPEPNLKDLS